MDRPRPEPLMFWCAAAAPEAVADADQLLVGEAGAAVGDDDGARSRRSTATETSTLLARRA